MNILRVNLRARPPTITRLLNIERRVPCLLALAIAFLCIPAAAQLAAKPAADWIKTLDSSNRVAQLKIGETITKLRLNPGDKIADIGAGSGVFSLPLAKAVSPRGVVFAVDIDQGLLDHIASRAAEQQLTNVESVLGKFTDPNLPTTHINLVLINDVLHHIADREVYLKNLARYVEPSGRVAIIDFYPESGPHKSDPALQVTRAQADAWMATAGFSPTEDIHLFQDKWFVIYSRGK